MLFSQQATTCDITDNQHVFHWHMVVIEMRRERRDRDALQYDFLYFIQQKLYYSIHFSKWHACHILVTTPFLTYKLFIAGLFISCNEKGNFTDAFNSPTSYSILKLSLLSKLGQSSCFAFRIHIDKTVGRLNTRELDWISKVYLE